MNTKISKDTFLMGALLTAALLTVGFASIRTNEDLLARDASDSNNGLASDEF